MARSRAAIPPTADQDAQRAANRAAGRHARPAEQPQHAAEGAVSRWYHVLSHRGVHGHVQGERAQLALTDAQASALVTAGHIIPVDESAPVVAAEPAPVETGTTPEVPSGEDDNTANSAE